MPRTKSLARGNMTVARAPLGPKPRKRQAVAKSSVTGVYECWVSGNALEAGVNKRFPIKHNHTRKSGLGYRVRYDLSLDDAKNLVDVMSVLALDISDEHGYTDSRVESIYRDLGKFPAEVQPR